MKVINIIRQHFFRSPARAALAAGIITFITAVLFVNLEVNRLKAEEQFKALGQMGTLRARLEGQIKENLAVLKALRAEVALNPAMSQDRFESLARELMSRELHIRHIALAPGLVVKNIYPLEGNEKAIGLDYTANMSQLRSVMDAVNLNKPVLSGPVNLVQGGEALIARIPVYIAQGDDAELWGIISAVLNYESLLETAGIFDTRYGLKLSLRGPDGSGVEGEVFYGDQSAFSTDALLTNINLPHGTWQMAISPVNGWSAPLDQLVLLWSGAVILSLVFASFMFFLSLVNKEKYEALATANYRANFDALTGLPNRYYFTQRLNGLIRTMRREEQDFAVFYVDIDHFKTINDSLGHVVGDKLLCDFAIRLQKSARETDIVARLAGDEFVIVLRNVGDVIQADLLAEKLQNRIQEPFFLDGRQHLITASIGIAMFPVDGEDVTSLILHSDQAMYSAKRMGRNNNVFFNEGMREEAEHYLAVNLDIQRGLKAREFELHYQPILNLKTNRIEKCEALIRWRHPEKGLLMPDSFIPVAERTGTIRELGDWVLAQACRDMRAFQDAEIDLQLSINRSVGEFYSSKAYESWKRIFSENGVDPRRFIFEITESLFMEKNSARMNVISALRKLGVQFAIDDFGTGYSAINYLRNYPADFLKIDKSFIHDLLEDPQDRTLVEVIIKMGIALNISVIAEGVESNEELELLQSMGCDFMQGFWLSKPAPVSQVIPFCHLYKQE